MNYVKQSILIFGLLFLFTAQTAVASALSCYNIDGMGIFGFNGSEWVHIGAIGNEFNSLSIANEFGAGNEFKSSSIFNEFGKYGSEFSSYSAFNDFASKPPIIVNDNYRFVGYLTTGYKTPYINTYEAVACAKNSFRSPNRDMVDITFRDIPSGSSSYSYSSYSPSTYSSYIPPKSCPKNSSLSTKDFSTCSCNSGYKANSKKDACIAIPKPSNNKVCQKEFGSKSEWDGTINSDQTLNCSCKKGYLFNEKGTKCIKEKTPKSKKK